MLLLFAVVGGGVALLTRVGTAMEARDVGARVRSRIEARVGALTPSGLKVPVAGVAPAALKDTWGQARDGGLRAHTGLDIPATHGTPVVAAAPGTVEKLFNSRFGGTAAYVRSPDRRFTYYYAHLSAYADGLAEGSAVRAGQVIGYVGDTGNAGPGNDHLHFGITRNRPSDRWWQGREINPYPVLAAGEPRG